MFNLKKHNIQKIANYDGVQGYFVAQTRAWQNCIACKQKKGIAAQKAWDQCLEDYQKGDGRLEWVSKYFPEEVEKIQKTAQTMSGDAQLQMGVDVIFSSIIINYNFKYTNTIYHLFIK